MWLCVNLSRASPRLWTQWPSRLPKRAALPLETKGDKGDKKGDKKKTSKRPLTIAALDCIRIYNQEAQRSGKRPSMKAICSQYAADNQDSFSSIYRTVKDHPGDWKGDKTGDKTIYARLAGR